LEDSYKNNIHRKRLLSGKE